MVTVQELVASTQLPDEGQQRLTAVMKLIGYAESHEVDDIVRGLSEGDLEKAAALAELKPPLTIREMRILLKKARLAGEELT